MIFDGADGTCSGHGLVHGSESTEIHEAARYCNLDCVDLAVLKSALGEIATYVGNVANRTTLGCTLPEVDGGHTCGGT